ncbi:N-acetyl-gamma-glutamyl-phosphate reductase [Brachybacterium paraconglomeratum]|uniref:N-acetyl-gamma-glutamyl-phosphate reductase n=1 Tax=Brachybacterium paraconglomeratum TaxID=173362 RepID=UPI0021A66B71|nr:N-acetyl-gamma-glutamyl-phosphate reductase [Brachybacterium paraconglomeratum]MCT1908382.1 N-acetyl-gamma-glutamyl-phosphate reductase [Brachybacterium paraconglomeratum]
MPESSATAPVPATEQTARRPSVAVVGASGYAGGETLRLLAGHPGVEVATVTAHSSAGKRLSEVAPHIDLGHDPVLQETGVETLRGHDVVVLALPHGQSGQIAAALRAEDPDVLVLDLGADHRLESAEEWEAYYRSEHSGTWTYGMPELPLADGTRQREQLRTAREIAVPGCNATAVTLALAPLLRAELLDAGALSAVLPVGYSGAGRAAKQHLLFSEASGTAAPYAVGGTHRHIPEVLQNLRRATGREDARLGFTPVLVPMSRGILAVCTAPVAEGTTTADLLAALEHDYAGEHFVTVLSEGSAPATGQVAGANTIRIGAAVDARSGQATVISAIDNLVKGTAGAALQSMNLALGLPEATGLSRTALAP